MINKYFALSVVAASVLVAAGCSSDDDDDDMTPVVPPIDMEPPVVVVPATPGVGGTAFDTIANSDVHNTLEAALAATGLDATLDDPANTFTVFAPTDAAFAALDADEDDATPTTAELLEDLPTLTRILTYHVVAGDVDSAAVSQLITDAGEGDATFPSILMDGDVAQNLTFTSSTTASSGVAVNGVDVDTVDVVAETEANGRVHIISGILLPPAAPVVEPPEENPEEPPVGGPTPGAGEVQSALESRGNFSGFLSGFGSAYGLTKLDAETDGDPWTVFAPTDAALAGAELVVNNHIATGSKLSPADLIAAGTFTSFNGTAHVVGGTEEDLTIGGFDAEVVGEGASITYSIEGVLP